jgi:glycosyltransferase involved in cell wall biosynthesis
MKKDFDVLLVPEFRHKDVPLAAWLSRLGGKRCVFDPLVSRYDTKIHDRADASARSFQAWHNRNLDRWSMGLADVVLADTDSHRRYYSDTLGISAGKIHVVRVGYDETVFRAAPDDAQDEQKRVLFYGSYLPLHGIDVIVAAAARLRDRADIHFELIGDGQTFSLVERFVREERLSNVTLSARVPMDELPRRICGATVCLGIFGETPKAGRVIPNKVYQCMGVGRTVITRDSEGMRELFVNGENVVLTRAADADSLADAVVRLCDDADTRARIAAAGYRLVSEHHNTRRVAEQLIDACGGHHSG